MGLIGGGGRRICQRGTTGRGGGLEQAGEGWGWEGSCLYVCLSVCDTDDYCRIEC